MRLRSSFLILCAVLGLAACQSKRVRRESTIGTATYSVVMPTGQGLVHPQFGKETWFAVGALEPLAPAKANGVGEMHTFGKGVSIVTVQLNITAAPRGSHHVAWVGKPNSTERVRVGELMNPTGDVRHAASVTVEKDLRDYTEVSVTLEKASGASESDPLEAKGQLTERRR